MKALGLYNVVLPYLTKFNYLFFGKYKLRANTKDQVISPFFIIGSGRNGSTLLSMILNGHSKIFIPNEQYALHYASIRFQLYNFLIWRDLVKLVIGEFADSHNNESWNTNFNDLYNKLHSLPKERRNFQTMIEEIIKEHARSKHEQYKIWGDKSPPTILFLKYIYRVYPKSKFIFLIRDGRDVVNSFYKAGEKIFGDIATIENASYHWKKGLEQWQWLKRKASPLNLMEVRYETLVSKPETEIKKILCFLDLKYEKGILNYENEVRKRAVLESSHHGGLKLPIHKNNIGKWKSELSEQQLGTIMKIIGVELKEYGYF